MVFFRAQQEPPSLLPLQGAGQAQNSKTTKSRHFQCLTKWLCFRKNQKVGKNWTAFVLSVIPLLKEFRWEKRNLLKMHKHISEYHLKSPKILWNWKSDALMWSSEDVVHLGSPERDGSLGHRQNCAGLSVCVCVCARACRLFPKRATFQ